MGTTLSERKSTFFERRWFHHHGDAKRMPALLRGALRKGIPDAAIATCSGGEGTEPGKRRQHLCGGMGANRTGYVVAARNLTCAASACSSRLAVPGPDKFTCPGLIRRRERRFAWNLIVQAVAITALLI